MNFANKNVSELYEYLQKIKKEIIADKRYQAKDADVNINAPLALIQFSMKTKLHLIDEALKILEK